MNRRKLLRTSLIITAGSLTGCNAFPDGPTGSNSPTESRTSSRVHEGITEARKELSEAAVKLNDVVVTKDQSLDIQSDDFDGFAEGTVAPHTDEANEELSAVRNTARGKTEGEIEVLLSTSTTLSQTAKQYADIDSTFGTFAGFENLFNEGDFRNAMRAAQKLSKVLADVTSHGEKVSEALVDIEKSNRPPRVKGFDISRWGTEQSVIIHGMSPLIPMAPGLFQYAKTHVHVERAGELKKHEKYREARGEFVAAREAVLKAGKKFDKSLDEGLSYKRGLIEFYNCYVPGYAEAADMLINSMDAYIDGTESKGEKLYQNVQPKLDNIQQKCSK